MKKLLSYFLLFNLYFNFSCGFLKAQYNDNHQQDIELEIKSKRFILIKELLNYFKVPYKDSYSGIANAIQKAWLRKPGQERWNIRKVNAEDEQYVLSIFDQLGMLQEIKPRKNYYDYVLVLGSTLGGFKKRLNYLVTLFEEGIRFGVIYYLSGDRPLDPKVDNQDILKAMQRTNEQLPKNESEMVRFVVEHTNFSDSFSKIPVYYVKCPMKKEERPNTGDTILKWLDLQPQPGAALVISNQPYINYQDKVVRKYLENGFEVETVGSKSNTKKIELYLEQLACHFR